MLLDFFGALGGSAPNEVWDEEIPVPTDAHQLLEALLYGSSPKLPLKEEVSNQLYAKETRSSSMWLFELDYVQKQRPIHEFIWRHLWNEKKIRADLIHKQILV